MRSSSAVPMSHHSPAYRRSAEREQAAFESLCADLNLRPDASAVVLYLLLQMSRGQSGLRIRARLRHLDVVRRSAGQSAWSDDKLVLDAMAGVYRKARLPLPSAPDPLYLEDMRALVDMMDRPTVTQLRDRALLLVGGAGRLDAQQLQSLQWTDVRIKRGAVLIEVTRPVERVIVLPATSDELCPVAALSELHRTQGTPHGAVFGGIHVVHVRRVMHPIPASGRWGSGASRNRLGTVIREVMQPRRRQLRNRALMLLSFSTYLRSGEVRGLRHCDVRPQSGGLLIAVRGRHPRTLGVRPLADPRYCPVQAWRTWAEARGPVAPSQPAFPELLGQTPQKRRIGDDALNRLLHKAVQEAELSGRYAFESIRVGAIRTALRSGAPVHVVAREAGVRDIERILRHLRSEQLLTANVAGELGL